MRTRVTSPAGGVDDGHLLVGPVEPEGDRHLAAVRERATAVRHRDDPDPARHGDGRVVVRGVDVDGVARLEAAVDRQLPVEGQRHLGGRVGLALIADHATLQQLALPDRGDEHPALQVGGRVERPARHARRQVDGLVADVVVGERVARLQRARRHRVGVRRRTRGPLPGHERAHRGQRDEHAAHHRPAAGDARRAPDDAARGCVRRLGRACAVGRTRHHHRSLPPHPAGTSRRHDRSRASITRGRGPRIPPPAPPGRGGGAHTLRGRATVTRS